MLPHSSRGQWECFWQWGYTILHLLSDILITGIWRCLSSFKKKGEGVEEAGHKRKGIVYQIPMFSQQWSVSGSLSNLSHCMTTLNMQITVHLGNYRYKSRRSRLSEFNASLNWNIYSQKYILKLYLDIFFCLCVQSFLSFKQNTIVCNCHQSSVAWFTATHCWELSG